MHTLDIAAFIVDSLYQQGVTHFCVAPGSRSTPLALSVAEHQHVIATVHFDERGLGFYALGLAKALKKPVAIVVTSGTALVNLYPSIMEAHLSRVSLIILSADRPIELRDCGANQTIDQVKFFEGFVRFQTDLSLLDCPLPALASTLSYAVALARETPKGPVHINCQIREPFLSRGSPLSSPCCVYEPKRSLPPTSTFAKWGQELSSINCGVILLGSDALEEDLSPFIAFAEKLGWPIFSDIISGGRNLGDHSLHIEYSDLLLKTKPLLEVDAILQIGNRLTSKTTLQWIEKQQDLVYFLVTDHPFRQDPLHKVSYKIECTTSDFCSSLLPYLESAPSLLVEKLKNRSLEIKSILESQSLDKSEPALFHHLKDLSCPFFFANSMPIRDADLFFFPKQRSSPVFANRGTSGIDGNIATSIGLAHGLKTPLIACIGDLATLHDLNSFALLKDSLVPIFFIVINNQGGGIFSFLPVAQETTHFEKFIAAAHTYDFALIAQMFSLDYIATSSVEDVKQTLASSKSALIEYQTSRQTNVLDHQAIVEAISYAVL